MTKKTRNILDAVLWILGIVAIGFLLYGIIKVLF